MTSRYSVVVIAVVVMLVGCAAPAASGDRSASASAAGPVASESAAVPSASAAPSDSAAASAAPAPSEASSDRQLAVPGFASVVADTLQMRQDPGLNGEVVMTGEFCIDNPDPDCERPFLIGTENGYVELYLVDGPVEADGYAWYLAATEMHTEERSSLYPEAVGWVAAGDGTDAWLVPASRTCPTEPVQLADVTLVAMTRLEMLHCFGSEPLTLRGWYPELPPGEEESPADRESCLAEAAWLLCGSIFDLLRPEEAEWAGDADYLSLVVDVEAGVTMPARSQWIEVTGSLDHPQSATCGDAGLVVICRSMFVVSSARPSNAP
jgi:hypothetical protein